MWTPVVLDSGQTGLWRFGSALGHAGGHFEQHGGQWQGLTTAIVRFPDQQLTVVVFDK